jgi:hypothetical protein
VSAADLIVSLKRLPTPEEHAVAEGVSLHDGAGVPFHMFVKVAMWAHRHENWIAERDDLERKIKRRANAAIGLLATSILTVIGGVAHRLVEEGRDDERAIQAERAALERRDALEREIQDLRLDVRELRAAMRRMSGADPTTEDADRLHDKTAESEAAGGIFAAGIPFAPVVPRATCGALCTSNAFCSQPPTSCKYCNGGFCSFVPLTPEPPP